MPFRMPGLDIASATHLIEPIRSNAVTRPNSIALWFMKGGATTPVIYSDFVSGMNRWSNALTRLAVGRGDVVMIFLDHDIDQYLAFFGAIQIGAIPSFMPPLTMKQIPELYWDAHASLIGRIRPRAIIVSASRVEELRSHIPLAGTTLITPDRAADASSEDPVPYRSGIDDTAFLQHSSGTTQTKKGVQLSHRAVLRQLSAYATRLSLTDADRIASWLPLYHDMGLIACCVLPLVLGIPVVAIDAFEWTMRPELLLRAIETYDCTLVWTPNFAFHHIIRTCGESGPFRLGSLRAWIDCSEPCKPETFDLFARTFAKSGIAQHHLQVCYAMAETVFAISQTEPGRPVRRLRVDEECLRRQRLAVCRDASERGIELLSNGTVLPGLSVFIVDPERRTLPEGSVGEVAVRGDFLFSGYRDLPERTREQLVEGTYYTRDRGFVWENEVYILGRTDDLMIINGRNFHAHEIEALVNEIPDLKAGRNVVFSVRDSAAGTDACVLVAESEVLTGPAAAVLTRKIKQHVFSQSQLTLQTVHFVAPGALVKTTSGKISRSGNRARYLGASAEAGTQ